MSEQKNSTKLFNYANKDHQVFVKNLTLEQLAEESRKYHTDPYKYAECKLCGFRSATLAPHIKYHHDMTVDAYKKQFGVTVVASQEKCDSTKGENNPAYGHGGKFSPFSKNFIKYDGMSDEEKASAINDMSTTAHQTMRENGNITTTLDYWLKKTDGNVEEAKKLLAERQSTFSLPKCIENYGEEEGTRIWKERQERWQSTLQSKSPEEIADINSRKVPDRILRFNSEKFEDVDGILYVIRLSNGWIKFGITTREFCDRYNPAHMMGHELLCVHRMKIQTAMEIEQNIRATFKSNIIDKSDEIAPFGYTEIVRGIDQEVILETINEEIIRYH